MDLINLTLESIYYQRYMNVTSHIYRKLPVPLNFFFTSPPYCKEWIWFTKLRKVKREGLTSSAMIKNLVKENYDKCAIAISKDFQSNALMVRLDLILVHNIVQVKQRTTFGRYTALGPGTLPTQSGCSHPPLPKHDFNCADKSERQLNIPSHHELNRPMIRLVTPS